MGGKSTCDKTVFIPGFGTVQCRCKHKNKETHERSRLCLNKDGRNLMRYLSAYMRERAARGHVDTEPSAAALALIRWPSELGKKESWTIPEDVKAKDTYFGRLFDKAVQSGVPEKPPASLIKEFTTLLKTVSAVGNGSGGITLLATDVRSDHGWPSSGAREHCTA